MVHGMCEQRKESTKERPYERVDCNCAVGVEPITIDEVAHALPKRYHTPQSNERSGEHLWNPGNFGIARPGKPEKTNWQRDCSDDHRWKPFLGDAFAVFDVCAREVGGSAERDEAGAHDDTDDEGSEG